MNTKNRPCGEAGSGFIYSQRGFPLGGGNDNARGARSPRLH